MAIRMHCKSCNNILDRRKKGATKYGYCDINCQIYYINKTKQNELLKLKLIKKA